MNIIGNFNTIDGTARPSMWKQHQRSFDLLMIAVAFVVLWQVFFQIGGSVALASPWQATRTAIAMLVAAAIAVVGLLATRVVPSGPAPPLLLRLEHLFPRHAGGLP